MLKVINLYVIDKIFEELEVKVGQRAKILYINCLINHFKDKKATVVNAVGFDMFEQDFGDFNKYRSFFQELHKARLVELGIDKISFYNSWGKHIDRNLLENVSPEEYVAGFNFNSIDKFSDDLRANRSMIELCQMKYHINTENIIKLIDLFITEQRTFDKKYIGFSDCVKHFTYWLPSQIKQMPKEAAKQVKSQSKIIGN